MLTDHYSILGVPYDATADEIRTAYFDAARKYHPDANPDPLAKERFLKIQEAFDVLSNPQKRTGYDRQFPDNMRAALPVSLASSFSRSDIPQLEEDQLLYVLLDLSCNADLDPSLIPPIHLCLVIDRSTSMQGARMDMVKANISHLFSKLRKQDIISVVAFSDRAEVILPPTRVSELGKLENRVNQIQTGGSTEIFQGLEAGVTLLRNHFSDRSTRLLVLLTDGHTYGDEQICYNLAQQVADENIAINVMGIGHEWNDAFLDRLSSLSGGSSIFVSTPKDLYNYLEHKMQSAETVFGRGVRLEFTCDPNVELTYAFRLQPELGPLELASPILIGNLMFGKNISILLEFVVHSVHQGVSQINLLDGKMTMEVPSMTPPMRRVFVKLNRQVKAELTRELPPAMIVDALSKLTLYRMQDKARREVSEGKIDDATRHLQQLATHLLAKGNRELAHTVLVEAEQIHQNHHFSKDGDKKIKYGTRALLMLPGPEQTRS